MIPACFLFGLWVSTQRFKLPFRLPKDWQGKDYSNPVPGSRRRFRTGQGILFLGNDYDTGEELWISNSDARRHAFVLGTTGAGKALPVDSLIYTPSGWVRNGDIVPGDEVFCPSGKTVKVVSVHPQGRLPAVRLRFADGREAESSRDHLWYVKSIPGEMYSISSPSGAWRLQTASDIGLQIRLGLLKDPVRRPYRLFIPLSAPIQGTLSGELLSSDSASLAARFGIDAIAFMPSLAGSPKQRQDWLGRFLRERKAHPSIERAGFLEIPVLCGVDGYRLRHLVWSLGGFAIQFERKTGIRVRASFPGQDRVFPAVGPMEEELAEHGLEIVDVEGFLSEAEAEAEQARIRNLVREEEISELQADELLEKICPREQEMSCLRTSSGDGLFVMENYLVTHNTELLLGLVSQAMMWSSGFMFIDGKGTIEFHAKAWSLVSRFGRQDDYRILNFTDGGSEPDLTAGGPDVQSNTLNPFSHGSPDQLMNLIVSLMGDSNSDGSMWKHRAMSLVSSAIRTLCEMRDSGDVLLDVQAIRDFLPLGVGVSQPLLEGMKISRVSQIPDNAWKEVRTRGGMIELYLRALNGEFSETSKLALKGFFDSLPGFDLVAALNGKPQVGKAVEQHGFLCMQLTKPLGSLADDFGHIFRTPFGEVDINDVVLNRRILVVLLPALQKAPEEMRNCGRIVVSLLKLMMGKVSGAQIEGGKRELVDARPTKSPAPFIAVLDEIGYYMVRGLDTMMAQARSLGFMIIVAGQDMASMQSISPQIAETAAANSRLTVAGATEDSQRTWRFLKAKFGRHQVPVSSGKRHPDSLSGQSWTERNDVSFTEGERVKIGELQQLREGEFYFLMESTLVKANAFYSGEYWASRIKANKFLIVRGPTDRVPGLDQEREERFVDSLRTIGESILDQNKDKIRKRTVNYPFGPQDSLECVIRYTEERIGMLSEAERMSGGIRDACLCGLLKGSAAGLTHRDSDDEEPEFEVKFKRPR